MKGYRMEKEPEKNNARRDFLKYSSLLGSAALLASPVLALAAGEAGGNTAGAPINPPAAESGGTGKPAVPNFKPEEIGKAVNVLFKNYSKTIPYQHKFNDALVKAWLNSVDYAVSRGEQKEFIAHYIATMKPVLEMQKNKVARLGKETALTCMFEGTMCSVQLFEEITIQPNERIFPCPYKQLLELCRSIKMFTIEWKDVCNSLCVPLYTGFGKELGVEIKMTPGEICSARMV
jgi:hypothetical protein